MNQSADEIAVGAAGVLLPNALADHWQSSPAESEEGEPLNATPVRKAEGVTCHVRELPSKEKFERGLDESRKVADLHLPGSNPEPMPQDVLVTVYTGADGAADDTTRTYWSPIERARRMRLFDKWVVMAAEELSPPADVVEFYEE